MVGWLHWCRATLTTHDEPHTHIHVRTYLQVNELLVRHGAVREAAALLVPAELDRLVAVEAQHVRE